MNYHVQKLLDFASLDGIINVTNMQHPKYLQEVIMVRHLTKKLHIQSVLLTNISV